MSQTAIFYIAAVILFFIVLLKDKEQAKGVIKKAVKQFINLFPQILFIMLLLGLCLSIISPEFIANQLGDSSGVLGIIYATLLGSITFLPSFIAIPLGANVMEQGAGLLQVAGFISALMAVGVATFPVEKKVFGTSFALYRNIGSLAITFIFVGVLAIIGV